MDTSLTISIIAAVAENSVIGQNGKIPWDLPDDRKHFAELTKGHKVIVGRKTYESIIKQLGHFLIERQAIILTRQENFPALDQDETAKSWEDALEKTRGEKEVFVIGGAEIYALAIPEAKRMYITKIHVQCDGNTIFPRSLFNISEWQETFSEPHTRDQNNEYDYTFAIFERKEWKVNTERETESFVNLDNARLDEQREIMKTIQKERFCPFCPKYYSKSELEPIIKQGKYWHIRKNRWPYENTQTHFVIIHNKHVEKLSEINPQAAQELFKLAQWVEKEYKISGGGLCLRFGDININGGTVLHLHAHIITADITNRDDPKYQPVRFRVG